MEISKLTTKYQATIPQAVRQLLALEKGDSIAFRVEGNQVVLKKATALDMQFALLASAALTEWNSREDDEAFRNL